VTSCSVCARGFQAGLTGLQVASPQDAVEKTLATLPAGNPDSFRIIAICLSLFWLQGVSSTIWLAAPSGSAADVGLRWIRAWL